MSNMSSLRRGLDYFAHKRATEEIQAYGSPELMRELARKAGRKGEDYTALRLRIEAHDAEERRRKGRERNR